MRQGSEQLKEKQRQMIYKELVEKTAGIWQPGDGLAYQEKLRAEWEQRPQDHLLKASDEDNLR